jgi:hypothetical protein
MADEEITRTERLLALLVLQTMAEASQIDKCVLLNRAGFGNAEIAELLGTNTAVVTQNLYEARKTKGRKPARKATKKTTKKSTKKATRKGRR